MWFAAESLDKYGFDVEIDIRVIENTIYLGHDSAKQIIKDCKTDKSKTYIRINNEDDLNFVTDEKFLGIFLPFTESKSQLENLDQWYN